jgi:drug/metabolite transporter (DMT)-like permease
MPQNNTLGVIAMLAAMAFLIVNDAIVKYTSSSLPTGEIIFVRGLMASAIILTVSWSRREFSRWRSLLQKGVILRTLGETIATMFYLSALVLMPIGNVTAILQVAPLMATAGSAIFLREQVGLRRWMAAIAGFLGVLLIIKPGAEGFNIASMLALAGVFFVTVRDVATRTIHAQAPSFLITAASAITVTIAGLVYSLFDPWVQPNTGQMIGLGLASVCILGGYYFTLVAFRVGEVSFISPFRYSIIIWAILLGYFVWGDIPDNLTFVGIFIVIAAGVYTFRREARPSRTGTKP